MDAIKPQYFLLSVFDLALIGTHVIIYILHFKINFICPFVIIICDI